MTEDGLQIIAASWLTANLHPSVIWWHTPNGGLRNPVVAKKLSAMGVRPGIPDLLLDWPDGRLAIELKSARGRVSKEQKDVGALMEAAGRPWHVARSLDEVRRLIAQYRVPRRQAH